MEERSKRRCLRNNTQCVPMENMFKDNDYMKNSAVQCVPPEILNKLKKFQVLTCDDINSLSFVNNESHFDALERMKQVREFQKNAIDTRRSSKRKELKKLSFNAGGSMMMDEEEPRPINNQVQQNQYKLGVVYEKHNHYGQYGEEILYNQFFRNDLQNLFLQ